MKKIFLVFTLICVALMAFTYLYIPNYISLKAQTRIIVSENGLKRELLTETRLSKWWPAANANDSLLQYKNTSYKVVDKKFDGLIVLMESSSKTIKGTLSVFPSSKDIMDITWESKMATSWNPFLRWKYFTVSRQFKNNMQELLDTMKRFYDNGVNIYGIDIRKELVMDSNLIFTSAEVKGYPTMEYVYGEVDKLEKYAGSKSAQVSGLPMLNINTTDSINYLVKVAVPVNKMLPSSGDISYRWMLGRGNILIAEIKGGNDRILHAFKQMEQYASDYNRVAPAIPFQSLVTNRLVEKDSSKWVTRVCYPVM
ncbi:MAG: hypothetical protein IPP93_09635 [Chitinophagaceae bacterium]|nr:hypothetical protein [Chitinophagaceae bacterium]